MICQSSAELGRQETVIEENARTMDTQGLIGELSAMQGHTAMGIYWVNLSIRGGKDMGFQGLARLLREISRGRSQQEILRSHCASPRKTPSLTTLLLMR